jgi:type 1 glutamine amidotransferase
MRQSVSLLVLSVLTAAACGRSHHQPQGSTGGGAGKSGHAAGSTSSSTGGSGAAGGSIAVGAASTGGRASVGGAPGEAPQAGSDSGGNDTGPYAPRSGKFEMVVYSKTSQFRHAASIESGTLLLRRIAAEVGADVLVTEENSFIENLDAYELVFFMNTSGSLFNTDEKAKLEAWMKRGGAFCGTHSAAETEYGWPFYLEVIGQNDTGHGFAGSSDSLVFEDAALDHPAVRGLPNPWQRQDEWLRFDSEDNWRYDGGFTILARKSSDGLPISWVREHDGYRSFYTGLGHHPEVFGDLQVKRHLTGGITWAVRREHCLATPKPAGCPDAMDSGALQVVPPKPSRWTCSSEAWGDGVCHCGCGVVDWDCDEWTLEKCEVCNDPMSCSSQECPGVIDPALVTRCELPFAWACEARKYGDGEVCDCGCSAPDPDCPDSSLESCDVCDGGCAGLACPGAIAADDNSVCAIPPGWRCGELYADGSCDCGCGALDLDCDSTAIAACDRCDYGCAGRPCPATIDPEDNTTCNAPPPGWQCLVDTYADGLCHCGCGALDIDCETVDVADCDICNSFGSCSAAACPGTIQTGYSSSCVLP